MARLIYLYSLFLVLALASCAKAAPLMTNAELTWVEQTEQQAIDEGISPAVVRDALDNFKPNPRVIELDQKQPETTITFATYRHNTLTSSRIKKGSELLSTYANDLRAIEKQTGVPAEIIVALWGIESSYGQMMGDFDTINSLATLAYEGRRADFFRSELFAALRIIDREHIPESKMHGSWAGAMGQCQFMPSTYLKYAVDGDGDGQRDIWNDPVDVLSSIANYLSAEGWHEGMIWGLEVKGSDISSSDSGLNQTHSFYEWAQKGITQIDGSPLPSLSGAASYVEPDGPEESSFLVTDNVRALMRWNHSTYFALSVGLMGDELKKD